METEKRGTVNMRDFHVDRRGNYFGREPVGRTLVSVLVSFSWFQISEGMIESNIYFEVSGWKPTKEESECMQGSWTRKRRITELRGNGMEGTENIWCRL